MKKFLYAALSLLMLASCSDDPLKGTNGQGGSNPEDNTPGVYIGVNFQMPGMGSSRSTTDEPVDDQSTSNDGTEIGQNYENNVNEVLLILARKSDYGFIGAAKVSEDIYKHTSTNTDADSPGYRNIGSYHAIAKFSKSQIEEYYDLGENGFEKEIAVFVVVNPNGGLENYFAKESTKLGDTGWINEPWKVSASSGEGAIWSSANGGNFLMTNSRIAFRQLPAQKEDWERFSESNSPFHLSEVNEIVNVDNSSIGGGGAVNVHRACARFDFKDGSDDPENFPNRYPAVYYQNIDGTQDKNKPLVYVTLQRMSLVNMNNTFYYFERVSDNGLPTGENFGICKPEKPWYTLNKDTETKNDPLYKPMGGNYVVDYYAQDKYDAMSTNFNFKLNDDDKDNNKSYYPFDEYFEYPLFDNNMTINEVGLTSLDRWGSSEIADVLKGTPDNYDPENPNAADNKGEYHIWRYVTENVIPQYTKTGANNTGVEYWQPNGLTTGIVFRARMSGNTALVKTEGVITSEQKMLNHVIYALNGKQTDGTTDLDRDNSWKNPFIYQYARKLYATWQDLAQAAVEGSLEFKSENGNIVMDWNRTASLYMAVFGDGSTGCTIVYNTETGSYNVYLPSEAPYTYVKETDTYHVALPDIEGKTFTNGEEFTDNNVKKVVYIDNPKDNPVDTKCANQKWLTWDKAGKPSNTDDGIYEDGGIEVVKKDITKAFKEAVTGAEITIYQSSVEDGQIGYYCYYYYWNRHNDNNRNGVMGPMEFCTVRNNVYKLSVTDVSRLGHPRLDENDPNTPKPNDPDESSDVYITVDSKVIPWVVRVNDIQF